MSSEAPDDVVRVRRHGPVTVTDDCEAEGPMKLYAFCKRKFPILSKKVLVKCFLTGCMILNGKRLSNGHSDESKRIVSGDVVEILIDLDAADARIIDNTDLNVLHIQNGYAVLLKPCGVSAAFKKDLDKALKAKLWNGQRKRECQLLYHMEKGFSGICIVAETAEHLFKLRTLACASRSNDIQSNQIECTAEGTAEAYGPKVVLDSYTVASDLIESISISKSKSESESEQNLPQDISQQSQQNQQNDENQTPFLKLIHRCIICGKIGEIGEVVILETGHRYYPVRSS